MREPWNSRFCHIWLWTVQRVPRFFGLLLDLDRDLLEEAREAGCLHCGEVLHRGDYGRKPRGGPERLHEGFSTRFSLCCSKVPQAPDASLRSFLGAQGLPERAVVLVSAMLLGPSPPRAARLKRALGVSRRTLCRWRIWWRDTFGQGPCFRSLRGLLPAPVERADLPLSLLGAVDGRSLRRAALTVLELLQPISSSTAAAVGRSL